MAVEEESVARLHMSSFLQSCNAGFSLAQGFFFLLTILSDCPSCATKPVYTYLHTRTELYGIDRSREKTVVIDVDDNK